MSEPPFTTCQAWLRQFEHFVGRGTCEALLRRHKIDRHALLTVVRAGLAAVEANGRSTLTHDQLAELSGQSRKTVLAARLVIIEGGFEAFEADPARPGEINRVLQQPPSVDEFGAGMREARNGVTQFSKKTAR